MNKSNISNLVKDSDLNAKLETATKAELKAEQDKMGNFKRFIKLFPL